MSTRCAAGKLGPGNKVTWIYIHQNGYVKEGTGEILMRHYSKPDKVNRLLKHGSASIIAPELKDCVFHTRDWRRFPQWGPETEENLHDYIRAANNQTCEFAYLYGRGQWHILNVESEDRIALVELTGETVRKAERSNYRICLPPPAGTARSLLP